MRQAGNGNGDGFTGQVSVLIQDPHTLVRGTLRVVVEQLDGAIVVGEAASPEEALEVARQVHPDIVFLDLNDRTAVDVIKSIVDQIHNARVICLADEATSQSIEDALRAGATAFALKSDSVEDLLRALEQVKRGRASIAPNAAEPFIQQYMKIIQEKHSRDAAIISALASAIEAKDHYSGGHTQRVARLASRIARVHEPPAGGREQLFYGFTLHDVGKIGVPEEILLKESELSTREWEVMRTHPLIGVQIIRPVGFGEEVENIVMHHHERWDGGGYPAGLEKEEIPLSARLFAVADAFDAMTSDRPYRKGMPIDTAMKEIVSESGKQFDPSAVDTFVKVVG